MDRSIPIPIGDVRSVHVPLVAVGHADVDNPNDEAC